ncbi:BREX-1 system adenine-specific DNA-methyltransferase PglX [[Pseudopropionibacterium] massiliense]|uniref:BREX-1 system adenine-specific DNA-methyltransferase PglX n=1 Tax=[Pseudopropionibacterium] massiliense TaxID=2220000 RepID=UPI0010323FD9|nr:BREX-1 system adenine-specific DNA-methyltransferase PglX [[Pseudopropionibacterium] massiliense]
METAPLKSFATWARRELITQVSARLTAVLAPASPERVENQRAVAVLEHDIAAAGGGTTGREAIVDRVAYTWFNRIIAFRFMDANGYTGTGVVSPAHGQQTGQPEILADAKRGNIDPAVVGNKRTLDTIIGLLDSTRPSTDAQGEAYTLLLAEYCRYWNRSMPFMFEREGDYTELLIPSNLLAADSILTRAATALTEEVCRDVEVIGWLYQFYISERKDEVFAGFKKGKKAGAAEIPAATQLFTPHWIVRYLVENSVGRLWMLNHPSSRLVEQMDYYIAPVDEQTDFLKISTPEELTFIDPACGSGHMLAYAFDLLYAIYEEEGYAPSEIPGLILSRNLYGTEIDPRAAALAAFALMMKARARKRRFLRQPEQPRIRVIEPVAFSTDELDQLAGTKIGSPASHRFWQSFIYADVLGSLIVPDAAALSEAKERLAVFDADTLDAADLRARAEQVVAQAEYLTHSYAVVATNPPYMGSSNMGSVLSTRVKKHHPEAKSDLFAAFIERCLGLAEAEHGLVAMITMQAWMFLGSFEKLRRRILHDAPPVTMLHLGERAFDLIGGEVVSTTAFILEPRRTADEPCQYFRVVPGNSEAEKEHLFKEALAGPSDLHFSARPQTLLALPGGRIAYWLSPAVTRAFATGKPLGEVAAPKQGLATADNARFLRQWFEVSQSRTCFDADSRESAVTSGAKWFPHLKGGAFRKWWGNQDYVINWENDGAELWNFRPRSVIRNPDYYFKPAISWSNVSSGEPSFRFYEQGSIFGHVGQAFFPHSDIELLTGFSNSTTCRSLLAVLSPTLHFEAGQLAGLPIVDTRTSRPDSIFVRRLIHLFRSDWNAYETSWGFEGSPLVQYARSKGSLVDALEHWWLNSLSAACEARKLETENNRYWAEVYGLQDEVPIEVPMSRVSLTSNPYFRYAPNKGATRTDEEYRRFFTADAIRDLVSYGVGCLFGRYSIDKPDLILADHGTTVQDYLAKVPQPTFMPGKDNVLPIVDGDWFEGDIVARFRQFLRVAFGDEHFEENLRFIEESLGVKSLREYFITRSGGSRFYDDHVKRYKKRPIYWLFSSPKGSFNALIYMHRYTPSTVSTVLNEYLREFESKLEANLQHQERVAAGDGTSREKAAALKEAERLRNILVELSEYEHDVLYPLASKQVAIDLDDGVKANYPKFYPALRKIKGLEAADD